jgi:hypothetical protein
LSFTSSSIESYSTLYLEELAALVYACSLDLKAFNSASAIPSFSTYVPNSSFHSSALLNDGSFSNKVSIELSTLPRASSHSVVPLTQLFKVVNASLYLSKASPVLEIVSFKLLVASLN